MPNHEWTIYKPKPPAQWQLAIPPDASLEDVIGVLNELRITFTDFGGEGEAALYRQLGSSAVHFRRLPTAQNGG